MILVAGGTGTLGRELVPRLATADDVRVLTRDRDHAEGLDADVAVGDVRDASTLASAVRGCSVVVSAMHGFLGGRGAGPDEIDRKGNANLIRAAVDAGVDRFVLMSVFDARPDHPMALHRAKHAAEQELRATGLAWTCVRPTAYLETWAGIVGAKLADGGPGLVLGRGANPINFVSVADVAAVVERAVADTGPSRRTVDVVGPENLTMTELAERLGADRVRRVPRVALRVAATCLARVAPGPARAARGAVVMDTTDMTAGPAGSVT